MARQTHLKVYTPNKEKLLLFSTGYEFSQFYRADFWESGIKYPTTEHYMMYKKALLFRDKNTATLMRQETAPSKVKKLGRKVKNFEQLTWDENKIQIVFQANLLKFGQNEELLDQLCSTEGAIIAEASASDKVWGIGLRLSDTDATNPDLWNGTNLLGYVLMEVRKELLDTPAAE